MTEPAIDCRQVRERTCAYLGGELGAAARAAFDAHLAGCADCVGFLESARATSCKHVADFLSDYIEDELASEERVVFEQHLEACSRCVDYVRSFEATVRAGREVCGDDCPPIPDELVRAILDSRRRT